MVRDTDGQKCLPTNHLLENETRIIDWIPVTSALPSTPSAEPKVPFRKKLQDVEVREKESALLQCEVPVANVKASWYMEETRLQSSSKYHMEDQGILRSLTIHNVTTNDDAVYICEMHEGSRTVAELTVLGEANLCQAAYLGLQVP